MRRLTLVRWVGLVLIVCFIVMGEHQVFAAEAYPDPNRVTPFNKIADSLATMGQDQQEAKETLKERHQIRKMERESAINREKRRATQRRIKQEQQLIMEKLYGQ